MNLVRVGPGTWEVLLTEHVVEVLADWGSAKGPKKAMLSFLRQSVPMNGPQEGNVTVCIVFKPSSLKLAEFRKGSYPGTKIRVIWFYGDEENHRVVCVRAFTKNDLATPPGEIPAASQLRREYFQAKASDTLKIDDLPPAEVRHERGGKARKGRRARRTRR